MEIELERLALSEEGIGAFIPSDVVILILDLLPLSGLALKTLVCRTWRQAYEQRLYHRLFEEHFRPLSTRSLRKSRGDFKSLYLDRIKSWKTASSKPAMIAPLHDVGYFHLWPHLLYQALRLGADVDYLDGLALFKAICTRSLHRAYRLLKEGADPEFVRKRLHSMPSKEEIPIRSYFTARRILPETALATLEKLLSYTQSELPTRKLSELERYRRYRDHKKSKREAFSLKHQVDPRDRQRKAVERRQKFSKDLKWSAARIRGLPTGKRWNRILNFMDPCSPRQLSLFISDDSSYLVDLVELLVIFDFPIGLPSDGIALGDFRQRLSDYWDLDADGLNKGFIIASHFYNLFEIPYPYQRHPRRKVNHSVWACGTDLVVRLWCPEFQFSTSEMLEAQRAGVSGFKSHAFSFFANSAKVFLFCIRGSSDLHVYKRTPKSLEGDI